MTMPQETHDYPPTRWIAMTVLLIAGFMNLLDVTIVNVALPQMQQDLGATSSEIEWVVAAYALAFSLGLLPFGRLGDHLGRRRIFLIGVVLFTICSFLCGVAPSMETLIAARALQGLSGAMMAPQTLAIAQVIFPPQERGMAFAMFGLTASLASVAGPIAGGLLIQGDLWGLDWRPIFLVNIPVGVLAIVAGLRFIPHMPGHRGTGIDRTGIALAGLSVFLLVFPLIEGHGRGWPLWCFAMMAAAVPTGLAFVMWQQRQARLSRPQLVPASLLANSRFLGGTLLSTIFFSAVPSFFLVLAVFFQTGFGLTPLESGLASLPFSIGVLLSSLASGRLGSSWQRSRILAGALMLAVAMAAVRHTVGSAAVPLDTIAFLPYLLLGGFGLGTAISPMFQTVLSTVGGRDAGSASGALQSFQQAGGALGVALVGQIFFSTLASRMGAGDPHAGFVDAMQSALAYQICIYLVVALGAFLLPRPPAQGAHGAHAGRKPEPVAEAG